ncbi:MAG: hypothetical protein WBX81_03400, partial [Nitrososphaeraceae archaeon]
MTYTIPIFVVRASGSLVIYCFKTEFECDSGINIYKSYLISSKIEEQINLYCFFILLAVPYYYLPTRHEPKKTTPCYRPREQLRQRTSISRRIKEMSH